MQANKIVVTDLQKKFTTTCGSILALDGVSFTVVQGEFVAIIGPSGCGKTTLLRILGGLEAPTSGEARALGSDDSDPLTSMVFQGNSVFPWMTVRDNVAYGLRMRKVPARVRQDISHEFLAKVGLSRFADAYPGQLSEGMRQRVNVARAFANDPQVLLMDEPFGSLDQQNRYLLQDELLHIWQESRKTVVFVTHSIDEALILADRVLLMTARPGSIKAEVCSPFARPRDIDRLRTNPELVRLSEELWLALKEEVLKARALEVRSLKVRA
jgi:NitT/TauT family transport system ATP-binding protein